MKIRSVILILCLWWLTGTGLGQAEEVTSPAKESADAQQSVSPSKTDAQAQQTEENPSEINTPANADTKSEQSEKTDSHPGEGAETGKSEATPSPTGEDAKTGKSEETPSPPKEETGSPRKEDAKTQSRQGVSQPKAIAWVSYEEGLARGKNEKKKIFLNFYADWCQYCKIMEVQTFRDSSVVKYLNENFISVRVNSDHNRKIAADYNVTGLPVSWFIAENGESIGSQPGFLAPDTLLPLLKYIYTDSYKKMNFMQFMEKM